MEAAAHRTRCRKDPWEEEVQTALTIGHRETVRDLAAWEAEDSRCIRERAL